MMSWALAFLSNGDGTRVFMFYTRKVHNAALVHSSCEFRSLYIPSTDGRRFHCHSHCNVMKKARG
jgi:hypothetical protein